MTIEELWEKHTFRVLLDDLVKAVKKRDDEMAKLRLQTMLDFIGADVKKKPEPVEEEFPALSPEEQAALEQRRQAGKDAHLSRLEQKVSELVARLNKEGQGSKFSLLFPQSYEVDKIAIWLTAVGAPYRVERVDPPGSHQGPGGRSGHLGHINDPSSLHIDVNTKEGWLVHFTRA